MFRPLQIIALLIILIMITMMVEPVTITFASGSQAVNIPDKNLEDAIRSGLFKDEEDAITVNCMKELYFLFADDMKIENLTGLEHAVNLIELGLAYNNISDINALSGLSKLKRLRLSNNPISNMQPIANLTGLERLRISSGNISDITPLSGLTGLKVIALNDNQINNISALTGLNNLEELSISGNNISSISVLSQASLSKLESLDLSINNISNISAITGSDLKELKHLNLSNNKISSLDTLSNLPELRELFLSGNQLVDAEAFDGITLSLLNTIDLSGNNINNISGLESAVINEITNLDLSHNQIVNISALSALTTLQELDLSHNQIVNISALSALTTLQEFNLSNNNVIDIGSIDQMKSLRKLDLAKNKIKDLTPLGSANMKLIREVDLSYNEVSDISALSKLVNLTKLDLSNNKLNDINALSHETFAKGFFSFGGSLNIANNNVSDLTPLRGMNLFYLNISGNQVKSISSLAEVVITRRVDFRGLLNLSHNLINDLTPLAGLSDLDGINLSHNRISSLKPLADLTGLKALYLNNNYLNTNDIITKDVISTLKDRKTKVVYEPQNERGIFTGKVTDVKGPLEGVQVGALDILGGWFRAVTDEDGNYELLVPSGGYRLFFKHPGYGPREIKTNNIELNQNIVINMKLVSALFGNLKGTVKNAESDNPVPGVQVLAIDEFDNEFTGTTGSNGTFDIHVPEGIYQVRFSRNGYIADHKNEIAVQPNKNKIVDIKLKGIYGAITGRVRDINRNNLQNAVIKAVGINGDSFTAKANFRGQYEINAVAGEYTVRFINYGFYIVEKKYQMLSGGGSIEIDAELTPWSYGAMRGKVVDAESSKPLADVQVVAVYGGEFEFSTKTKSDGTYELTLPATDWRYDVEFKLDGYKTLVLRSGRLEGGEHTKLDAKMEDRPPHGGIPTTFFGDVNGDGGITVNDAILVLRHIVGLINLQGSGSFPDDAIDRAKVSGGGNLTVQDAILILRRIVGLIDHFPVEKI